MGYTIELSFNVRHYGRVTQMKEEIETFARNHKCETCYFMFEFGEKRASERNHCVFVVEFDESEIINIVQFLNNVIKNKDQYYVDAIYRADNISKCTIIHASPHYLSMMTGDHKRKYKQRRKKKEYTRNDYLILRKLLNLPKLSD